MFDTSYCVAGLRVSAARLARQILYAPISMKSLLSKIIGNDRHDHGMSSRFGRVWRHREIRSPILLSKITQR